jgi:hypothetical protein
MMSKFITRPRSLLLAVALAVVAALCSVSTAVAASAVGEAVVPAPPSNLTAKATSPTSVHLTWTNNASNQSGVVISRDGVQSVDLQGATVSSYTWDGLSPGTVYWFAIASKIYGTPGDPTGPGNTQSAWVGPVYATTPKTSAVSQVFSNPNWNGYVTGDPGANITLVSAQWTVPADACRGAPALGEPWQDNVWVGLGGINIGGESKTPLVQIGTFSKCDYYLQGLQLKVRQQSWAIEEVVYPDKSCCHEVTGRPVAAGDTIDAFVEDYGPGEYDMSLSDKTQGWNWGPINVTVPDTRTPFSAEWIVESGVGLLGNLFPMADFKQVSLTSMYYETTTAGVISGHGLTDSVVARLIAGTQTRVAPVNGYTGVIGWRAPY